jgi:hypothetical protein
MVSEYRLKNDETSGSQSGLGMNRGMVESKIVIVEIRGSKVP